MTPEEVVATQRQRHELLNRLVELRREERGDDLTSALIELGEQLFRTAGHETTLSLLEDIEIAGVPIPRGEAILAPYSGVGRDSAHHSERAGEFDITRPPSAATLPVRLG